MKLPWGELLKEEPMLRIKQIIWKIRVSVLKKLRLVDQRTVYFEGGLGSQVLAYIEYNERNKSSNKPIFANLDYFKNIENDFTDETGLSRWTWKLDQYGIYRHELKELTKIKKLINKSFKVRQQSNTEIFYNFREKKSDIYQKIFAMNNEDVKKYLLEKFRSDKGDFAMIHIRRGDYLNVASKVVSTEELINFVNKIKKLLPENVLISSDSFLPSSEKALFSNTFAESNLVYVNPHEDPVLVHHLMRSSTILVASNSTFSFTAGLLAKSGSMVFFPTNYFGQNRASDSRSFVFRQPFEFLVN